jgi:hypothetical protein
VTRLDRRAVGMLAGTVVLVAVMVPLAAGREQAFDTVLYATLPLVLGVVGTLIASRHPGNLIGWMLCGLALWGAVAELGEAYGYVAAERGLPGGVAGEWLISWSWIVDVTAWVVVVLLFPNGRLPGRRWRPVIWTSLAGAVLLFVGQALDASQTVDFSSGRSPLGVDSPLVAAAWPVGAALLVAGLVAAVAASVLRYRRARDVERQQLKWFAYAGLIFALVMPLAAAFWYRSVLVKVLAAVALNAMPLAIGAAILRYRLYDIDRIVSRTLTWALLTVVLGLGYAGVGAGAGPAAAPGLQPGGGRRHPGRGRGVPARPPPGPGRGGPALQPSPLRRRPDHPGVQRPAAPAGRPGQPDRRAAGRGGPDDAAGAGDAVAAGVAPVLDRVSGG